MHAQKVAHQNKQGNYGRMGYLGRTGNSAIWQLFCSRQMGKASLPKNRMLKAGHGLSLEVAALPGWAGQRLLQVECHPKTGVEAVPPGMALPYCPLYVKGAPMPHVKMPPVPPDCSGWGHIPHTTVCARSAGCYRWWNSGSGWWCLPWTVSSSTECPPISMPGLVDGRPSWWAGPVATESWPLWCHRLR